MAEVRKECGITEEEVYQSLCVSRDMALRDAQEAIANDEYTLTEGDDDFKQNALRLKLAAYNILQNAVERHEKMHETGDGFDAVPPVKMTMVIGGKKTGGS